MAEKISAAVKGERFISLVKKNEFVTPTIVKDPTPRQRMPIRDETGGEVICDSFVSFSHEAMEAFPGSYISPERFQQELEGPLFETPQFDRIMGSDFGSVSRPTYEYNPKDSSFSLAILHGATNDKAINLARIAKEGFTSENRALYQQNVADMIKPALVDISRNKGSLRIHDDCLASTVSIAGYLASLIDQKSELLKGGIDIIIDGPATAQGILFLKKFAEVNNITLSLTASFLAFGLTEGEEVSGRKGVRKHANYITLPDELFNRLPLKTRQKYFDFSANDNDRAVVGDMGNASLGIVREYMDLLIQQQGLPSDFCAWNDGRTDPHHDGNSPKAKVQLEVHDTSKRKTNVYFPRGGYISYAYDKTFNPQMFDEANTLMIGATRLWSPEHGYGVAYGVEK
jgi:hypothetical protein